MKKRIVFMGSPDFALPTLKALAERYHVVGVVTQPDRPSGRGRRLVSPPVKGYAVDNGIDVIQPEKLRQPEVISRLQSWSPDLIVVAAFGQILRQNILDLPAYGCINVHGSLLPRWRGAAPIQAAITNGDAVTGVTIMKMDAGIDTGGVLSQLKVILEAEDTSETLGHRLAAAGADLLVQTLPEYLAGRLTTSLQDNNSCTYASMINKEDGLLDFNQSAETLERRVRAFKPWPGTYFYLGNEILKVHRTHVKLDFQAKPGLRSILSNLPAVGTSSGWLLLDVVQPAGRNPMAGEVYLRGARNWRTA
jgi:methionyl-tRNA formyltransferase